MPKKKITISKQYFKDVHHIVNAEDYMSDTNSIPINFTKHAMTSDAKTIIKTLNTHHYVVLSSESIAHKSFKIKLIQNWLTSFFSPLWKQKKVNGSLPCRIKAERNSRYYVSSNTTQPMHTDQGHTQNAPDILALYCDINARHGGDTILVPFPPLYAALRKQFKKHCLSLFSDNAVRVQNATGSEYKPILFYYGNDSVGISYSPIVQRMHCSALVFEMFDFITQYVHNKHNQLRLKLKAGDLIIMDNRQMLHGRLAFPFHEKRLLYRFWLDQIKH